MNTALIIVAAGKGARFEGTLPKQHTKLGGLTILERTLKRFADYSPMIETIVIVHASGDAQIARSAETIGRDVILTEGGDSRSASVRAGLDALSGTNPDYVLIHDAARPFVSSAMIGGIIDALSAAPAAVPVLPVRDALKQFDAERIGADLDRASVRAVQTPQGFHYAAIKQAYDSLPEDANLPDDIAAARQAGLEIAAVPGEERNFKITYPQDMDRANAMIRTDSYLATGQGFDVHQTEDGDSLWLCGIEIPAGFSLKGHSDADVGLHALCDAIFGALADGDIGDHFPPSDDKWKDCASHVFVSHARKCVQARGGAISHVDVTLICEQPKVKPHRLAMREKIAELLELDIRRVSVKATTTEKLGFTGRGEGIAAQAIATLELPID